MPTSDIAPLIIGVTITLSVAAIFILRPIATKLGSLFEAMASDRGTRVGAQELERLTSAVSRLTDRIETLEDRQDFAERILGAQEKREERPRLRRDRDH